MGREQGREEMGWRSSTAPRAWCRSREALERRTRERETLSLVHGREGGGLLLLEAVGFGGVHRSFASHVVTFPVYLPPLTSS